MIEIVSRKVRRVVFTDRCGCRRDGIVDAETGREVVTYTRRRREWPQGWWDEFVGPRQPLRIAVFVG